MIIPRKPFLTPQSPRVNAFYYCNDVEVLVYGARNTSKSFTMMHYALTLCEMHPGIQIVIARYENKTMGVVYSQLNNKILKYPLKSKSNPFEFRSGTGIEPRTHILFNNGSKICFGGLDDSEKLLGGEFDLFWINEAHRFYDLSILGDIAGCIEGARSGNWKCKPSESFPLGYKYQIWMDCNPAHDRHPLWMRAKSGTTRPIKFRHKDHPEFYDWNTDTWQQKGIVTIKGLLKRYTTDFEKQSKVYGRWYMAEGLVFKSYDPKVHIVSMSREDFDADCKWYFSADWGGINAAGIWVQTPDTTMHLFKETYRKGESVEDTINRIKMLQQKYKIPKFEYGVIDHEIDVRFQLNNAKLPFKLAEKKTSKRIETMKWAFANNRIRINDMSLEDPDPLLTGQYQRFSHELPGYTYPPEDKKTGSKNDELPYKYCVDHAIDHSCYMIDNRLGNSNKHLDLRLTLGSSTREKVL